MRVPCLCRPGCGGGRVSRQRGGAGGLSAVFDAFPDAAWTNGRHFVAGDRGVSEWRFLGTDRQGAKVAVDGCDLFTFDGDLIAMKNSFRKQRR